jgi:hypothetical protein
MATASDGRRRRSSTRRLRFDPSVVAEQVDEPLELPGHSGRRFVTLAILTLLLLWGSLYLAFREWRSRYSARAAYGRIHVATAIDPIARFVPPGISDGAWTQAVAETHNMLVDVTGANLLDLNQMKALRDEVQARVARTRPETALHELADLWDELGANAGPVVTRRLVRPALLPPASTH